jgi:hypothetical protein
VYLKQYSAYKKKLGKNFIGPEEINLICEDFLCFSEEEYIRIPFSLDEISTNQLLILTKSTLKNKKLLTIATFKDAFQNSPHCNKVVFYNQDWYLNEKFYNENVLNLEWKIIPLHAENQNRGILPSNEIVANLPSAILLVYAFFIYACKNQEVLWPHDYLWCSDVDNENDKIYVGRYFDIKGLAKPGFSIHRHLSIKNNYTFFTEVNNK